MHPVAAKVRIQTQDFDLEAEHAGMLEEGGAVVNFVGIVRGRALQGRVLAAMTLEHYPGMTEKAIEAMLRQAHRRFDIQAAQVVHRVGRLRPGERIMGVWVVASHRGPAFQACEFLIDYLKTQAPFWKKEHGVDGRDEWVAAQARDDEALAKWGVPSFNATAPGAAGGLP